LKALIQNVTFFFPAIIWGLIILYLSSGSGIQLPPSVWDIIAVDKLGCLISSIYGICLEFMQYALFPNRYFEFLDIIANISGSLIGILFFKYIYYKTR